MSVSAIPATLRALEVPVEDLKPYPRNPRRGDVSAIVDSLELNGQYRPVVVNKRTMEVLAGNHTLAAARQLGVYGWAPGSAHVFYGGRKQDTVWEVDRPSASREHPTMKPTALFERMVDNSSRGGEVVYDPFGGSGTTLLAAENLKRHARLMELDPGYCDVIVDRYCRHTGSERPSPVRA